MESFELITEVGHVPAGDFTYQVFYQNCPSCLRVSAATEGTCPPIPAEP